MTRLEKYLPFLLFFMAFTFNSCNEDEVGNSYIDDSLNTMKSNNIFDYGEMHNKVLERLLSSKSYHSIETIEDMLILTKESFSVSYPTLSEQINEEDISKYSYIFNLNANYSDNSINTIYDPISDLSTPFQDFLNSEIGVWDGISEIEIDALEVLIPESEKELLRAFREIYFSSQLFWQSHKTQLMKCEISRQKKLAGRNQVYFFDALGGVLGGILSGGTASVLAGVGASALIDNIQEAEYCGGPITD